MIAPLLIQCALVFSAFGSCMLAGPSNLDELLYKYHGKNQGATYTPLPSSPLITIANNDTALLKVSDLRISHNPLKTGRVTFYLDKLLTADIPKDSVMELTSYVNGSELFSGTVSICDYLTFANMDCPVKADKKPITQKHVLQIPDGREDGRLTFLAKVTAPDGALIIQLAGIVDLVNDGTVATEEDYYPPMHDEL